MSVQRVTVRHTLQNVTIAVKGVPGKQGAALTIEDAVPTYADLPGNLTAADKGKAWLVNADGRVYVWRGDAWPSDGEGAPFVSGGMTQDSADARYIQKTAINAANGVAGLDANRSVGEDNLPLPPVTLTILFQNKLA